MDSKGSNTLVCVLIVSYNFEKWIYKCLSSLQNSSIQISIVVIDNGSDDNTCEILRESYPEVILIENIENLGFGRANNIGMEYILKRDYKYVFLLNQDAWVEPDTINKLVNAYEKNRDYGILSPVHLNGDGSATDLGFSEYTGIKNRTNALQLQSEITEFSFINAAMWLIPVSVWKVVGGFAPIFTHYGEDLNWVQRAKKYGYKIGVVKSSFAYHDRESRPVSREKFYYSEYVYFLTEAVNPLYTFQRSILYSLFAALKKASIALFSGKPNICKEYFRIAVRLIAKTKAIQRTRKEIKTG